MLYMKGTIICSRDLQTSHNIRNNLDRPGNMLVIPESERLRQKDYMLKGYLVFIVRSCFKINKSIWSRIFTHTYPL